MTRPLMNALLYFPSRKLLHTPADANLGFDDLAFAAADGRASKAPTSTRAQPATKC